MEIKLIACDMDGTLLDSNRKISERTKQAVAKCIEAGKMFIIATGRMYIAAKPYAEQLGLDVPIVTYNGGLIRGSKSGKVFLEQPIKLEIAQEFLDFIKEKGNYAQYYVGDELYIKEPNKYSYMYGEMQGIHSCIIAKGEEFFTAKERPYKILMSMEPEELPTTMAQFRKRFAGKLDITSSHPMFLELLEPGVNKWQAICKLAEKLGIKQSEIMCLGDSDNDYEMVANAGIGVAMANATDKVKSGAKIITASNDNDGVAIVLESILTPQAKEE